MIEAQTATLYDAEARAKSNRRCGDCQLCCKLLPVQAVNKPGNTKCGHQRVGKGCDIYHKGMPIECQLWSCVWLTDPNSTTAIPRPDRAHYVIDPMPDMILSVTQDGRREEIMVAQVWIDPAFPAVFHDPSLRAYIELVARRDNMPTKVIFGRYRSILVAPPSLTGGEWFEMNTTIDETSCGNRFVDMLSRGRTPV